MNKNADLMSDVSQDGKPWLLPGPPLPRGDDIEPYVAAGTGPSRGGAPSAVNHPPHYGGADNPYEVIKIEEALGLVNNHYRCTALEYILRAGKKDPSKVIEDLEKSVWWLQREIAWLKRAKC